MTNERIKYYYDKYHRIMGSYAISIISGCDSIPWGSDKDIVSDAFLSLATKFAGNGNIDPEVRAYLNVCVRNGCFNLIKHHRRRKRAQEIIAYMSDDSYFDACNIKAELYNKIIDDILKAIDSLPIGQRMVFKMVYIERMSQREICAALNIKASTINVQIMRAKHKLREQFKGREVY